MSECTFATMPIIWSESKWVKTARKRIHFSTFCMYVCCERQQWWNDEPPHTWGRERESWKREQAHTYYICRINTPLSIHILYHTHTRIKNPSLFIQFRLYTGILFEEKIKKNIATNRTPVMPFLHCSAIKFTIRHVLRVLPMRKLFSNISHLIIF